MTMDNHLKVLKEKVLIMGRVTTLTPLHIGWQRSFDPVESDSPVIKDPAGFPYIPGSSFKGILRGFIEGFLNGAGVKSYSSTDDECCDKSDCKVCSLFGSMQMGSKLKIKDMQLDPELWNEAFIRVRDGVVIDRDSRTAKNRGKYDFETVAPGVEFYMEIVGDNLSDAEKGLLFTALDFISRGFASLGGNVSRGTGRVGIRVDSVEINDPVAFFDHYIESGGKLEPDVRTGDALKQYIKETKDSFVQEFSQLEGSHV